MKEFGIPRRIKGFGKRSGAIITPLRELGEEMVGKMTVDQIYDYLEVNVDNGYAAKPESRKKYIPQLLEKLGWECRAVI